MTIRPVAASEPDRARRNLAAGIVVVRWTFLALMTVLAATSGRFRFPAAAWLIVGAVAAWTVWLTVNVGREGNAVLWLDLALGGGVILASALATEPGRVVGSAPFFATGYPASAALLWGAVRGPGGGLLAGGTLATALVLSRPVNGVGLDEMSGGQVAALVNGVVYFLAAGGAAGVVSRLLERSSRELRAATEEALRARERAARLAERESLARDIHDSVLQALALVHKRGRELAERDAVAGAEVGSLADVAGEQERALRAMIMREPDEAPSGTVSLRDALERAAREVGDIAVTVSAVGLIFLPARTVEHLQAAVRQALHNVVQHAAASRVAMFAEAEDGWVSVSVRDDGCGFRYDESALLREGKAGMLRSMKGRVEDLGGAMRVVSAPGAGTEVEFRIPVREGVER
jgi:signal transduction histidine kinase